MSSDPEFFIDRSLGKKVVPNALRAHGLTVHTMASIYGEDAAQRLRDERWLHDAGEHRWIVLMKDDAIRRRPIERDALVAGGVRAFCLTNANLRGADMAERFVENRHRIMARARQPGPYIYGVYASGLRRLCLTEPPAGPNCHPSRCPPPPTTSPASSVFLLALPFLDPIPAPTSRPLAPQPLSSVPGPDPVPLP